jgi:putative photosynthetic complex assembly protein
MMNMNTLPLASAQQRRPWFTPGAAILLMIATTLLTVSIAKFNPPSASDTATEHITQQRLLRFDDLPDGAVAVIDVDSGELVQRFEGEQGFLRGTLRAMARERKLHGVGRDHAFQLLLHADGRLTLLDPHTSMRIALESFGATNTGVFARLLR